MLIRARDAMPSSCKTMQDGRVVVDRFSELGFRTKLRFKATLAPNLTLHPQSVIASFGELQDSTSILLDS